MVRYANRSGTTVSALDGSTCCETHHFPGGSLHAPYELLSPLTVCKVMIKAAAGTKSPVLDIKNAGASRHFSRGVLRSASPSSWRNRRSTSYLACRTPPWDMPSSVAASAGDRPCRAVSRKACQVGGSNSARWSPMPDPEGFAWAHFAYDDDYSATRISNCWSRRCRRRPARERVASRRKWSVTLSARYPQPAAEVCPASSRRKPAAPAKPPGRPPALRRPRRRPPFRSADTRRKPAATSRRRNRCQAEASPAWTARIKLLDVEFEALNINPFSGPIRPPDRRSSNRTREKWNQSKSADENSIYEIENSVNNFRRICHMPSCVN